MTCHSEQIQVKNKLKYNIHFCLWYFVPLWSWLNISFHPMTWLVFGHVNGIEYANQICHLRTPNHNTSVSLAFELIKKQLFIASICIKMKRAEINWYGNSYLIHDLDQNACKMILFPLCDPCFHSKASTVISYAKKSIQNGINGILSIEWRLTSFKNIYCYVFVKFYKQKKAMLKMHMMHKRMSNISIQVLAGIMLANLSNGRIFMFNIC